MALEQAREFLSRVIAWPQPGETAYTNLLWKFVPQDQSTLRKDKNGIPVLPWSGRATNTLDEAVGALAFASRDGNTKDIYLCLSTQAAAEERSFKSGRKWYKPIRLQENVVRLKSVFLDIDAKGADKDSYPDLNAATAGLADFLKQSTLPKPSIIVKSGGGLHVYWTLSRALTRAEWTPLAYALAEATKRHGLKCDTQCTIDSARVLRVPETLNYKTDPPRPVTLVGNPGPDILVEDLEKALEPYKVAVPAGAQPLIDPAVLPPRPPLAAGIADELGAGIGKNEHPPVHLDDLAKECAFIREAIVTGGASYTNPMWNLTTLISTFTDDARTDAHRMGCQHSGYSKADTDAFFDRKEREKVERGLGFPSCATISATGCTACQLCQHFHKGRSPLAALPAPAPAPAPAIVPLVTAPITQAPPTDLPPGYFRNQNGLVCKVEHKEGGDETVLVADYPMDDAWIQRPGWILHFNTKVERGAVEPISVPVEAIGSFDFRRLLQSQGFMVPVGPKRQERLTEFMSSWITRLQQTRETVRTAPFGWTVAGGKVNGFVYDGTVWMKGTTQQAAPADPVIAGQYAPRGDMTPWREMSSIITTGGKQDVCAILASAFAAPLVKFTGHAGVLMSAYSSESGIGKSTALKTAQAVWGHPRKAVQMLNDTSNAVMSKIGTLRALPLYWDELKTEEDTRQFVNLTFQVTQGKEKSRMRRDTKLREPGEWRTLLVSTSNDSLLDFVLKRTSTNTAGLYRIFEYTVAPRGPNAPQHSTPDVDRLLGTLDDNFGHAGVEYAKFLGGNADTIENDIAALQNEFSETLKATSEERFWLALVTVICCGARYANRLGLAQFDLPALQEFMFKSFDGMRQQREQQPVDMTKTINLSSVMQRFLAAHRHKHTLFTNRIHKGHGKPMQGTVQVLYDATRLDGVYVHIGVGDKIMRISRARFNLWLTENNLSPGTILEKLRTEFGARMTQARLGAGTNYSGFGEHLIEINLNNAPILDFIDEK